MGMNTRTNPYRPDAVDYRLLKAVERGLPLVSRPYAALAEHLGLAEAEVIARFWLLRVHGFIKRFGVVVRHRELGYRANAMVVWDVPDDQVAELGTRLGGDPNVTLCYRRPRRPPHWPYNLFTMIHGRDRAAVLAGVDRLADRYGLAGIPHRVLFSRRRFKQRGASYGAAEPAAPALSPERQSG
jgi:DNA-binding Lrp family transcriptional regulator